MVGKPFALVISMVLLIMRMKVLSEKRMELSQTIASLTGSIRTEKGCKRCHLWQSMEDENELCLLEEWDTQKNLMSHLKSGLFRILRGAMNLLKEPQHMMLHTVFREMGEYRSQYVIEPISTKTKKGRKEEENG